VASCGLAVLAVESAFAVNGLRVPRPGEVAGPPDTKHAFALLVLLAVIVLAFLIALVQTTARRCDLSPATVATGATVAGATAAAWLTVVVLQPAVGTRNGPALAAIVVAGLVAATASAHRTATRQGLSETDAGLVAGLLACAGTALLIGTTIDLLPLTGAFASTSAPPDHSGARLLDSVAVWLIGLIAAVALAVGIHRQGRLGAGQSATPDNHGAPAHRERGIGVGGG
jgi:hypothetical protein